MSQGAESNAPAPGTDPEKEPQTPPAAEPKTPDSSGPPDTIPYGRFKEVNDRLTPFKELEDFGYDADSLRQLAEWDTNFTADPVANWLQVGAELDLPEEVKMAIEAHKNGATAPPAPPSGEKPNEDEPPAWAKEIQSFVSDQKKKDEEREAEEEQSAFDQMVDDTLVWWIEQDKAEGLVDDEGNSLVPEEQKLSLIIAAAGRGGYDSVEKLREAARGEALKFREAFLKPVTTGRAPSPKLVPGGGATPPTDVEPPKTLSEASARAKEFLEKSRTS